MNIRLFKVFLNRFDMWQPVVVLFLLQRGFSLTQYAIVDAVWYILFCIPAEHRWWLEEIEKRPRETFGLDRAEVFFTWQVQVTGPWSRGEVKASGEPSPCGSDCSGCPAYGGRCGGCPATRHYAAGHGAP